MGNKTDIGKFIAVLSICAALIVLMKLLLPKWHALLNTLYYFTPLIAVSVAERSGMLTVLRRYGAGVRKPDLRKSLCYVIVIALALPILNMFCVWFLGNILRIGPFEILGIPKNDFMLYGIYIPENPVLRFVSVYLSSVCFALVAGLTYNMFFALGSEVAWRGFLNRKLRSGCWMKNIVIGVIWATWWLPVMIFNGYTCSSIAIAYVSFVLLSFLLDSIFRNMRSLLVTSAVRGVIVSSSCMYFVAEGNSLLSGLAGMVSLLIIILCMCIYRKFCRMSL